MRLAIAVVFVCSFIGLAAWAQCVVSRPAAPPLPTQLVINLPIDGGTQGCTAYANVSGAPVANTYAIGNAKCAVAVAIAQQAAANDNGWNDGGVP